MVDLAYLKSNVFPGESGGDYNALFGYANRGSGPFGGIKLTDMTINQVLDFTDPRGPYAQSVKGQIGRVATPTGAYQVVGRTLRDAVRGLGLTGNEVYDEGTQDRIGQWIYENQGPNAWEAWGKGGNGDKLAGGGGDVSLLGGTQDFSGDANMEPERKGLFGFLGDDEKRARLSLALSGLSMFPNEGIMQLARDTIMQARQQRADQAAQSQARAAENRTLQYIANLGTPQAQQALQYAQGTGDVAGALKMAMQTAEPERGVVVGGNIINPITGEVIYQPQNEPEFRRATPEEAAAYGVQAGQFGPDGRFYEIDVPQGMVMESDGQGGFTFRQGAGVGSADGRPATEGQLAGAAMLQRMTGAEEILRLVERETGVVAIPIEKTFLMDTKLEGVALTPTEQRIAQAQRDWVRAKLRKESGAVIGADEMAAEILTYFPQVGEGPEIVAQKAEARRRAEEQLKIGAGTAAGLAGPLSFPYSPPIRADELRRAGIGARISGTPPAMPQVGSAPVVIDGVTIQRVE